MWRLRSRRGPGLWKLHCELEHGSGRSIADRKKVVTTRDDGLYERTSGAQKHGHLSEVNPFLREDRGKQVNRSGPIVVVT